MKKLKRNVILILAMYVLGTIIRSMTSKFWATENDFIYQIGKYTGNTLQFLAILWSIINGMYILKENDSEKKFKLVWLFLNLLPVILIFISLIFV